MTDLLDRVSSTTALSEIAIRCARYGITKFDVTITPGDRAPFVVVMRSVQYIAIGTGTMLHEAFDDALARIMHRIGADVYVGLAEGAAP
jgi:hypothetical protein